MRVAKPVHRPANVPQPMMLQLNCRDPLCAPRHRSYRGKPWRQDGRLGLAVAVRYVRHMSQRPKLEIRDNPEKHRFETGLGDGSVAFAEYRRLHGKIVFTHTEVPQAHEGQGIGSALIRFALGAAREQGLKVVPICPFFAAYMKKHEEVEDLLDPEYRSAHDDN